MQAFEIIRFQTRKWHFANIFDMNGLQLQVPMGSSNKRFATVLGGFLQKHGRYPFLQFESALPRRNRCKVEINRCAPVSGTLETGQVGGLWWGCTGEEKHGG